MNHEIPSWIDFENQENNWFDFFHQHIDNRDSNNKSWKSRKQHLDALFCLADKYEKQLIKLNRQFQFWININDSDSKDDAIYIHTENPNNSEFPIKVKSIPDLKSKNENLEKYLKEKNYRISRFKTFDENGKESINYYIQKENLGLPIE